MKYQINPAPDTFKPVSITLTFESQAELDAMRSIANCAYIDQWMKRECGSSLDYEWFDQLGARSDGSHTHEFHQFMKEKLSQILP